MNLQEFLTFATLTLQNKEVIKEPKDSENTVFNEYVEYFKVIPNMLEHLITLIINWKPFLFSEVKVTKVKNSWKFTKQKE